jgi:hypothetical protein
MARQHGTGRIYVKWGAFYGRWRTMDGRYVSRRLGKVRERGSSEGGLADDGPELAERCAKVAGLAHHRDIEPPVRRYDVGAGQRASEAGACAWESAMA